MADVIVDCPKCGKKFSVPEGSPPGQFNCTECGTAVTYEAAAAAARPARARPARARPARGAARARPAARRGGGRRRGGRDGDDEGGGYAPPQKDNTALFAVLGLAAVVIIAVVIVIVASSGDDDNGTNVANTNSQNRGLGSLNENPETGPGPGAGTPALPGPGSSGSGAQPEDEPVDQPEPGPSGPSSGIGGTDRPAPVNPSPGSGGGEEEPAGVEPAADNAPSGGFYGMSRSELYTKDYNELVVALDHLDDTSTDLRSKIDEKCRLLVDYWAGRPQLAAREDLVKIGRPAVPKVLSAFRNIGDTSDVEGVANACVVDGCMREIAGRTAIRDPALVPMANPSDDQIKRTIRSWYLWWYSEGYRKEIFKQPEPVDEEE